MFSNNFNGANSNSGGYWLAKYEWADYSQYHPDRCHNGGNYAFYETWEEARPGIYRVRYNCSSDFPYCQIKGWHQECGNCCDFRGGRCRESFRMLSVKEIQKRMAEKERYGWELIKEDRHWRKYGGGK